MGPYHQNGSAREVVFFLIHTDSKGTRSGAKMRSLAITLGKGPIKTDSKLRSRNGTIKDNIFLKASWVVVGGDTSCPSICRVEEDNPP